MSKFVYTLLAGSLALVAVGCGPSSFHAPASPVGGSPVVQPAEKNQDVTAFRFAIDQKEVSEESFNQALAAELARMKTGLDAKTITVAEYKLTPDRAWAFTGHSAVMKVAGDLCAENEVALQMTSSQNQASRVLTAASGLTIPVRLGTARTLLEMPTEYQNPNTLFARGISKLQPADATPPLTSILNAATSGLSYNLKIEEGKLTLTTLKMTEKSQYLAIETEFTSTGCPPR